MNCETGGPVYIESGCTDGILKPTLMCFSDGRCYRLVKETFGKRQQDETEQAEDHKSDSHMIIQRTRPSFQDDTYDEGEDASSQLEGLEQTSKGFRLILPIPSVFYKYIIGAKGATRENIESDTKCLLTIPRRGEVGNVVIEGATPAVISHAKRRVEMVAWSNRFKEEPTHFISIPLTSAPISDRFSLFREQVLSSCGQFQGVVPEAFKQPEKLHLTLGVLRIFSQMEEEKAVKMLQQVLTNAKKKLRSGGASISLRGLDCMEDDIAAARVVYAKVHSSNKLQEFVDQLCDDFIRECPELMRREFERKSVKLHATLINSKFLTRDTEELEVYRGMRRYKTRATVNATEVFKSFGDFDFGEVPLSRIHLSKRNELDPGTGYYKCIHEFFV